MQLPPKQKLFYFFPVLLCFCLPFGSLLLSGISAAWFISSFFCLDPIKLKEGFRNKFFIVAELFFLLTVISALFSQNRQEGLFGIEVKLSFLIFPFLFFCFKWPINILKRCVIAFVSGCFFACIYLIGRAFIYSLDGQSEYFFYSLFSDFIHASYFAMYLILAITFVVVLYEKWFHTQRSIIYSSHFFVSIFVTTIFLCSSKLGIISFFICIPLWLAYRFRSYLNLKGLIILLVSLSALLFISVKLFPGSFRRMNSITALDTSKIDKTSSESTTVRVLIWQECLSIIKDHPLLGVGVGDANDALYSAYEKNGLTGALEHHFNAHNQYFQTLIGLGFLGFIFLFLLTFGLLLLAFRKRNFLLLIFATLIVLNFAVESMLQKSAGVLFFVFFYCLLNSVSEHELLISTKDEA